MASEMKQLFGGRSARCPPHYPGSRRLLGGGSFLGDAPGAELRGPACWTWNMSWLM